MTYTQFALTAVVLVAVADLAVLRTRLLVSGVFWRAYCIILPAQLLSNGILTGTGTVLYDGDVIVGETSPSSSAPPMFGEGRVFFAPVEDLFFGFALILLTLMLWSFWGKRGIDADEVSGPPRWVKR
jgi:hypothetical protein